MKKYLLLPFLFLFFQMPVFSQQYKNSSLDLPDWVKPGMSLDEVMKVSHRLNLNIEKDDDNCYEYTQNDLIYHIDIYDEDGLDNFWIYATENILSIHSVYEYFSDKYGEPDTDFESELYWEYPLNKDIGVFITVFSGEYNDKTWTYIEYSFYSFDDYYDW